MTEGNFVDYMNIWVASGNGGKGSVHLHREKYITKGGPDGGDGGRGGHIILRGNKSMWTLYHLKFKQHYKAQHGAAGSKNRSTGKDGEDIYIDVPLGTIIKDNETKKILFEITQNGEEIILAEGGKGGRGNWHFKSPTNQTPRYSQPGIEGKEAWLLHNIQESLWALRGFKRDVEDITVTAGIPWVIQFSASCCDEPDIHYKEDAK